VIQHADPKTLREHPKNEGIFGDPMKSPAYGDVLESIRAHGIQEPLIVKTDGTVMAGHMRLACALELELQTVPVRVHPGFESDEAELLYLVDSNTKRRQLTLKEIGKAYAALKAVPDAEGGIKRPRGRPKKSATPAAPENMSGSDTFSEPQPPSGGGTTTRDVGVERFGVSRAKLEAAAEVFSKPDVPEAVQEAVEKGEVSVTRAAEALKEVRAEKARAARAAVKAGGSIDIEEVPPKDPEEVPGSPIRGSKMVSMVDLHAEVPLSELKIAPVSPEVRAAYEAAFANTPMVPTEAPKEAEKLDAKEIIEKAKETPDEETKLFTILEGMKDVLVKRQMKFKALPDKERVKTLLETISARALEAIPTIPEPTTGVTGDDDLDALLG